MFSVCKFGLGLQTFTSQLSTLFASVRSYSLNHLNQTRRCFHLTKLKKSTFDKAALSKAVSDAEKIVGFPTSYLSLRALLSDELSAVALNIHKLTRSKHPLLATAKSIFLDSKHTVQGYGLVVLLLSKAITESSSLKAYEASEAFNRQRTLAELTELIYTAFLVHRGIVDLNHLSDIDSTIAEMELGNKMAVLSGDFLLANSCVALSDLKNNKVVDYMSAAIGDMSQGYFILPESGKYARISSIDDLPLSIPDWQNAIYLAHGSLLSNACKSTVELVGLNSKFANIAMEFGKHMTFAQQIKLDMKRIKNNDDCSDGSPNYSSSELCALPVVIAAHKNGGKTWLNKFIYHEDKTLNVKKKELCDTVSSNISILKICEEMCDLHRSIAFKLLHELPPCEARTSLKILTDITSS